jgi:hypothetical protein
MLFFVVVAIVAGFFGTPAGSHNFGIIFVWSNYSPWLL